MFLCHEGFPKKFRKQERAGSHQHSGKFSKRCIKVLNNVTTYITAINIEVLIPQRGDLMGVKVNYSMYQHSLILVLNSHMRRGSNIFSLPYGHDKD